MQFVLFVAFYAGTGTLLVILLGLRNFLMKTVAGDWTRFAFATPVFLLTVVFVLVCGYWHLLVFRTVFDSLVSGWVKLLLFCLPFVWFGLIAALFNRKYGR